MSINLEEETDFWYYRAPLDQEVATKRDLLKAALPIFEEIIDEQKQEATKEAGWLCTDVTGSSLIAYIHQLLKEAE